MATYAEIATINAQAGWQGFTDKVLVAGLIKAHAVINAASPPPTRLTWAKSMIENPRRYANDLAYYAVAANNTATVSQILTATDGAIQTNIDEAVDKIYAT